MSSYVVTSTVTKSNGNETESEDPVAKRWPVAVVAHSVNMHGRIRIVGSDELDVGARSPAVVSV